MELDEIQEAKFLKEKPKREKLSLTNVKFPQNDSSPLKM